MGGFAKLRDDFNESMPGLEPRTNPSNGMTPEQHIERYRQDVFRFLYLRSLFEIAGNLDSIALHTRALVEQSEKTRIAADRSNELSEEAAERSKEMLESIKTQMTELRNEIKFPKFTIGMPAPLVEDAPNPRVRKRK